MRSSQPAAGRLARPDGAEIAYEVTGEGPPLLFAHGLGGSLRSWDAQVAYFKDGHTVITFSHRGFAASTVPGGLPDPDDYGADALALLDHLGIERSVVVGQSMGGWSAVELALAAPERVAGLVLACTTGSLSYDGFDDEELARWRATSPAVQADLVARGIHLACGARLAEASPERHQRYVEIDAESSGLDKTALRARLHERRRRGPEDAARIACPVLCITGEDDCLIAPRGIELIAAHMQDARVVRVPLTGHSVYFERPDVFNALLGAFLQNNRWRAGPGDCADGVGLVKEMWVDAEGLTGVGSAGPDGEGFRALLEPGARLALTFEARGHFEAMTIYYQLDGREYPYTTDHAIDYEPYPEEWARRQRAAR